MKIVLVIVCTFLIVFFGGYTASWAYVRHQVIRTYGKHTWEAYK